MDFADLLRKIPRAPAGSEKPATASTVSAEFWRAFTRREPRPAPVRPTGPTPRVAEPRVVEAARGPEPIVLPSVEPSEIERELGLSRFASVRALQRLRREFALKNHPDRVPSTIRGRATKRMMIANAMIDSAMKRLGLGQFKPDRV